MLAILAPRRADAEEMLSIARVREDKTDNRRFQLCLNGHEACLMIGSPSEDGYAESFHALVSENAPDGAEAIDGVR